MPKTLQEILNTPDIGNEHRSWIIESTDEQLDEYILRTSNSNSVGLHRMALAERERRQFNHLKKPHWTMTPGFIVGFLAMVFAAIAAWPVIRQWIPTSQPAHKAASSQSLQSNLVPAILPALQITPSATNATPNTNLLKK
jgi:hypothetical protein